jgi:hypothetical protein
VNIRNSKWFILVIAFSIAVRLYLVLCTQGTYDMDIWEKHAEEINKVGLTEYYKATVGSVTTFNHPPATGKLIAYIYALSGYLDLPFKVIFRSLFASLDFVIAFYLLKIFKADPRRHVYATFYLLSPITFIFSSYHGNTDTSLGLFLLLSLYFISRKEFIAAGICLGIGVWVKWIILLVFPVLFLSVSGRREKFRFSVSLACTFFFGYAWYIVNEPMVLVNSIFGYTGQLIQTTAGIPVWGNRMFIAWLLRFTPVENPDLWIHNLLRLNNVAIVLLISCYAWLQRHKSSSEEVGRTIAEVFIIFYGVSNFWSFQYFAWSAPFLVFLPLPLSLIVALVTSAYIYALYSLLCESPLLLGPWDFIGHPALSGTVLVFRNLSIALLASLAIWFIGTALLQRDAVENKP